MNFALDTQYMFIIFALLVLALLQAGRAVFSEIRFYKKSFWVHMKEYVHTYIQPVLRIFFLGVMFFLLSIAVMQPQWGDKLITTEKNSTDILFVLDVSKSMNALDMSLKQKALDRITAAKLLIADLVTKHPENNYGLIVFAGDAFVLAPITFDTDSFLSILQSASTEDVLVQGTDLSKALSLALDRFSQTDHTNEDEEKRNKAIVLISDGGEEITPTLDEVLRRAKEKHIPIYTLGIGSKKGVPIPEGRDVFGRVIYKKHNGSIVYTKLNERSLQAIAKETGGSYWNLRSAADLDTVAKKLRSLQSKLHTYTERGGLEDQYQRFVLGAFVLFILYVLLSEFEVYALYRRYKKHKSQTNSR